MKTLKKNKKYLKLFNKYSKNKKYLNLKDFKKLIIKEFKLSYNNNVMNSCMNIWGTKYNGKYVIYINNFTNMFTMKEGFLKNIKL